MRQAWHIFGKDTRALRWDIAALLALTGFVGWFMLQDRPLAPVNFSGQDVGFSSLPLLVAAWWFLLSRAVHQEALPGTAQFWLTRPYSRKSLALSKLLFCIVWINLPLFAMQCAVLIRNGFSPLTHLGGLVWLQLAIGAVFLLPALGLAAVTRNVAQFILAVLIAGACLMFLYASDWISGTLAALALAGAGAGAAWGQYRDRATDRSRAILGAGFVSASAVLMLLPHQVISSIQTWFPPAPAGLESVHMETDAGRPVQYFRFGAGRAIVGVPIRVSGVPAGMDWTLDRADVLLTVPGIEKRFEGSLKSDKEGSWLTFSMPGKSADALGSSPVSLRAEAALTLFSGRRTTDVPGDFRRFPVAPATNCHLDRSPTLGDLSYVVCVSAVRGPDRVLTAGGTEIGQKFYSPFPATFSFTPVSGFSTIYTPALITEHAAAHLVRTLRMKDLKLQPTGIRYFTPRGEVRR
jgi:hypothetical protein